MAENINFKILKVIGFFMLILGMFFIGFGVTGKAISDATITDYCRSDLDCINGKICCNVYKIGFCNNQELCEELIAFSSDNKMIPFKKALNNIEEGNTLMFIAIIFIFLVFMFEKNYKKDPGFKRKLFKANCY